ncbi:unnamed protein product [Owenia fusiformis]|uniref:Uncharacterized protein n=1 Tax=Owenia fusiformis TaxID=6347 RepID=A0A8J1U332_OWEFU|nr:unnamed protein product [Owenia fusiformis]
MMDVERREVKAEPLSPPQTDEESSANQPSPHSAPSEHSIINGHISDESDAPLDFSLKRKSSTEDTDSEHDIKSKIKVEPSEDKYAKIGQPQLASPGSIPGTVNGHSFGTGGVVFPGMSPGSAHANVDDDGQEGMNNNQRPFKVYPKTEGVSLPIGYYGIPGLSMPGGEQTNGTAQSMTAMSEELFNQYRQQILQAQESLKHLTDKKSRLKIDPTSILANSTSLASMAAAAAAVNGTSSGTTSTSPPSLLLTTSGASSSASSTPSSSPAPSVPSLPMMRATPQKSNRKRPNVLPDNQKDAAYWERRRKNNDAAKRSRDARRAKEDEIAIRAAFLEQENLKLRVEVAALKNETAKLRCMLYNS